MCNTAQLCFPTLSRVEGLSEQTMVPFWLVCPKYLPTGTKIWGRELMSTWVSRDTVSSQGSPYVLKRWAVLLKDQHTLN